VDLKQTFLIMDATGKT